MLLSYDFRLHGPMVESLYYTETREQFSKVQSKQYRTFSV